MFKNISIIDNKIQLHRYLVSWQGERIIHSKNSSEPITKEVKGSSTVISPDKAIEWAKAMGFEYTVTDIEIPPEIKKYDGMEWTGKYADAIQMINNNKDFEIKQLKEYLEKTDYKSTRDTAKMVLGLLTTEELEQFKQNEQQRQEWRDKINALDKIVVKEV